MIWFGKLGLDVGWVRVRHVTAHERRSRQLLVAIHVFGLLAASFEHHLS